MFLTRLFLALLLALVPAVAMATEPGEPAPAAEPEATSTESPADGPDLPDDLVPAPPPEPPVAVIAVPPSDTLPEPVRKLIATAIASGDEAALAAVLKMAKLAYPTYKAAIATTTVEHDAQVAAKQAADERARIARLSDPNPLANWKGEVELGASRSTGNTRNLALYAAGRGEREGLNWRHTLVGRADLQSTDGVTTGERITASYQPNYKFDERLYAYGIGQFEHDRFLGYNGRYTLGGGIGYGIIRRTGLILDFEGGPALRHTNFIEGNRETGLASRASLKFRWTLGPNLQLAQDAAIYLAPDDNNAVATTSLDTRLIGALKARFSYNVQYERDTPEGRRSLDTLSRATLVYNF
jgi:putative salt-induced outer membrane protein